MASRSAIGLVAAAGLAACVSHPGAETRASDSLAGTSWQLVSVTTPDKETLRPQSAADFTLAFRADGQLAARVACNRGGASWISLEPGQLKISPVMLTKVGCPPNPVEDHFRRELENVKRYEVQGQKLTLHWAGNRGAFTLEPLPR